jgi:hypothetical protein
VDALVGSRATAMEPLTPEGHVLVEGEIWRAVASEPVAAGTRCAWWAMSSICCACAGAGVHLAEILVEPA